MPWGGVVDLPREVGHADLAALAGALGDGESELAVRGGLGLDGVIGDSGDGLVFASIGLGAFAMAAAPAVAGFVGAGGFRDAVHVTRTMSEIALGRNAKWTIAALEFAGVAVGIDIRRVVETGIQPAINTGIAHRKAGVGQVGAGVARAPLACFEQAAAAFA